MRLAVLFGDGLPATSNLFVFDLLSGDKLGHISFFYYEFSFFILLIFLVSLDVGPPDKHTTLDAVYITHHMTACHHDLLALRSTKDIHTRNKDKVSVNNHSKLQFWSQI